MLELFNFIIFQGYIYLCALVFLLGLLFKLIKVYYNKNIVKSTDASALTLSSGLISIIIIHFAGYFLVKWLFMLMGFHMVSTYSTIRIISGLITVSALTVIAYIMFKKSIKFKISFGNLPDKLVSFIIIAHMFLGFLAIGFIHDNTNPELKAIIYKDYVNKLLSFDFSAYESILQLKWVSLLNWLLLITLMAMLPFSNIFETIFNTFKIKRKTVV
jgi:hypothetical protein